MSDDIWVVNAFTGTGLKGNPAGVSFVQSFPDDNEMQDVSSQLGFSNSAFIRQASLNNFEIRWFTTHSEAPICGHATIAAAHILYEEGVVKNGDKIDFSSKSGPLSVEMDDQWYNLNFPAYSNIKNREFDEQLSKIVGGIEPLFCGEYEKGLLMEFTAEQLLAMKPNLEELKKVNCRALTITSKGTGYKYDFISRYFAPSVGIDELDHRDQGIQYLLWSDIGIATYVANMPYDIVDFLSHTLFKKSFSHALENVFSKIGVYKILDHPHSPLIPAAYKDDDSNFYQNIQSLNIPNHSGDTPLHISLEYGNLNFALKCLASGADIDIQNDRGLTPIHYAASLPATELKYKALKILASSVENINDRDSLDTSIPLTKAVISNDNKAVEILLNYGANASYINANKDNLLNIALSNKAYEVIESLIKSAPELLYFDNLEHQIPICELSSLENPETVISNFKELWEGFDESLCKSCGQSYEFSDFA